MSGLTKSSIALLTKALKLPATGSEQDWDIELADASRIREFLVAYQTMSLSPDDRFALMALVVGSVDRALDAGRETPPEWPAIAELLARERELHASTLVYWACEGESDPDSQFHITPLIRALAASAS